MIYAIEHAVRKGYSRAVFVYDCLSIDVRELEAFFAPMFSKIQFLWLPRGYLSRADALASVITSYSIHYTKLYECSSQRYFSECTRFFRFH